MIKNRLSSDVGRRLLAGGLPVAEVRRYVAELRDHQQDLVADGRAVGLDAHAAAEAAEHRLGPPRQLARAAIRGFRRATFVGRHPFLFFFCAPFFGLYLAWVVIIIPVGLWGNWALSRPALGNLIRPCIPAFCCLVSFAVPCLFTLSFYRAARRRALAIGWRAGPVAFLAFSAVWMRLDIWVEPHAPHGRVTLGPDLDPHLAYCLIPLAVTMLWSFATRPRRRHLLA